MIHLILSWPADMEIITGKIRFFLSKGKQINVVKLFLDEDLTSEIITFTAI